MSEQDWNLCEWTVMVTKETSAVCLINITHFVQNRDNSKRNWYQFLQLYLSPSAFVL